MVSVIIPIYNAENWLHRSVESVMKQTYKEWELILVDDGSTDDSLQKCKDYSFSDRRIKVCHQVNKGVTAARYLGFSHSIGDFVCFLDSDDELAENAICLFMSYQKKYGVDLVKCSETILYGNHQEDLPNKQIGLINQEAYIEALLKNKLVSTLHASLYCRELLDEKMFDIEQRYKLGEDVWMNVMMANRVRQVFVANDIVYHYYYNEESALQTQVMSFEYNQEISNHILNSVEKLPKSVLNDMEIEKYKYVINYFFVPEIAFSKERYYDLIDFFKHYPSLVQCVKERVNPRFVKCIDSYFLYRGYTWLYKKYILYFKQKGRKKKVIY